MAALEQAIQDTDRPELAGQRRSRALPSRAWLGVARRTLLERFRSRVGDEAVAVGHLYARKRLGIEYQLFVDDIAFGQDVGRHIPSDATLAV